MSVGNMHWTMTVNSILIPHTYLTMYSSMSVKRQIIRRYMYDSGSLTPLSGVQTGGMEWKVSDDWSLALEVNQNGEVVLGSVDCLIDLIRQGHRIKVGTDGIYEEATMVWVNENKVWAQTIDSLSRQGSQFYTSDPVYRSLHVISSSGLVQGISHLILHGTRFTSWIQNSFAKMVCWQK